MISFYKFIFILKKLSAINYLFFVMTLFSCFMHELRIMQFCHFSQKCSICQPSWEGTFPKTKAFSNESSRTYQAIHLAEELCCPQPFCKCAFLIAILKRTKQKINKHKMFSRLVFNSKPLSWSELNFH